MARRISRLSGGRSRDDTQHSEEMGSGRTAWWPASITAGRAVEDARRATRAASLPGHGHANVTGDQLHCSLVRRNHTAGLAHHIDRETHSKSTTLTQS